MRAIYKNLLQYNYRDYCRNIKNNDFHSLNEKKELCNYYDFCWQKYNQYNYPKFNYIIEQKLLYEGLTFSADAITTAKAIKRIIANIQIIPLDIANIEIKLKKSQYNTDIINKLNNILNVYGYFINREETWIHPITKVNYVILIFEPKFNNIEYTQTLKGHLLYHITTKTRLPKILKFGLIPKSLSKRSYHPDRIYLLTDNNDKIIQIMSNELYNNQTETVLLTIDLSKHPFPIKLYKDSECAIEGVYTLENISPDCIIAVNPI